MKLGRDPLRPHLRDAKVSRRDLANPVFRHPAALFCYNLSVFL